MLTQVTLLLRFRDAGTEVVVSPGMDRVCCWPVDSRKHWLDVSKGLRGKIGPRASPFVRQQQGVDVDEALSHRDFYERFQSFWVAPAGTRVPELIAPDAKIHFTGEETMSGAAYADWMANLLAGLPDLVVTPVDYAGSGDLIYIFWRASATINGAHRKYYGVDRFRVENGMAVEEHVIFDSATLQGPA